MKKKYKKIGVFLLLIGFLAISLIPIKQVNASTTGQYVEFNTYSTTAYYDYVIYSFPTITRNDLIEFNSNDYKWTIKSLKTETNPNYNVRLYVNRTDLEGPNPQTTETEIFSITTSNSILHISGFAVVFMNNGFNIYTIIQNENITTLSYTYNLIFDWHTTSNQILDKKVKLFSYYSLMHMVNSSENSNITGVIDYYIKNNQHVEFAFYNGIHNAYTQEQLEQEYANNLTKWVRALFNSFNSFFDIRIGSVTLGAIILIPLSISVTWFIIKNIKGGS